VAAQKGKDLLLKVDNGGAFTTVAGLRTKRLAFNSETVDVTDADSTGRWRELLSGSGVQRASLSGSGIFKDAQSDALIRLKLLQRGNRSTSWQLAIPDFGMVARPVPGHRRSNIPAATTAR
jgi:TP901-1 family phage major tail protein